MGLAHERACRRRPGPFNGKAEPIIKTLLAEWAGGRRCRANDGPVADLPRWIEYDNTDRTHTALGRISPQAALVNNLRGNHS